MQIAEPYKGDKGRVSQKRGESSDATTFETQAIIETHDKGNALFTFPLLVTIKSVVFGKEKKREESVPYNPRCLLPDKEY